MDILKTKDTPKQLPLEFNKKNKSTTTNVIYLSKKSKTKTLSSTALNRLLKDAKKLSW